MFGIIYIITNDFNSKVYIGQTKRTLEERWKEHKREKCSINEHNMLIKRAILKYGEQHFKLKELERCAIEDLNAREIYYISLYDSYKNGYNATIGGSSQTSDSSGEKNGRSLLNTQDVIYIRECYNNHIPFRQVYEEYKTKISKRGLQKVWSFETWKNIKPEYNTLENKYFHSHQAKAN